MWAVVPGNTSWGVRMRDRAGAAGLASEQVTTVGGQGSVPRGIRADAGDAARASHPGQGAVGFSTCPFGLWWGAAPGTGVLTPRQSGLQAPEEALRQLRSAGEDRGQ